jgi:tetratricopeptide (TPR) repeat protein
MANACRPDVIRAQLEKILESQQFARSRQLRDLLAFTVSETLDGHADALKEYLIATKVLHRPETYDPCTNSAVRVLAVRLRSKLKEYYQLSGAADPVVIDFPRGKYVPMFGEREPGNERDRKVEARAACSHGRYLMSKMTPLGIQGAIEAFQTATRNDAEFAEAYSGLSTAYVLQALIGARRPRDLWPQIKHAARTALDLDHLRAEAYINLGLVSAFSRFDWSEAEMHLMKAIEVDPYSGDAYAWLALACWLPQGRMEAAEMEIGKTSELRPVYYGAQLCTVAAYFLRRYHEVLEQTAAEPLEWLPWLRPAAMAALGLMPETQSAPKPAEMEAAREQGENNSASAPELLAAAYAQAAAGNHAAAQELERIVLSMKARGDWVSHYGLAAVQAALKNRRAAASHLRKAIREREPWCVLFGVDSRLDRVRNSLSGVRLVSPAAVPSAPQAHHTPDPGEDTAQNGAGHQADAKHQQVAPHQIESARGV